MIVPVKVYNFVKSNLHLIIFGLSYVSLFLSFYIDEDGTGRGASGDFKATYGFILALKNDLLANPVDFTLVHTPLHFIIMSLFEGVFNDAKKLRLFYCTLTILLPIFFYQTLKKKELIESKKNFLLLSSIILILPSFRYASIWATDLITSLIFFQISILFFWKWNEKKSKTINKNLFFQIIFLALATYCRQYFAVFFIYFLFIYFQNLNKRSFINLFIICIATSLPVLYYTYLFPSLLTEQHISFNSIKYFLLGNSSMMSVYLIPFFFINIIYKKIKCDKNILISILSSFVIVFILTLLFKPVPWQGGGVIHKLSNVVFGNNLLFFISSFFTFLIFIYLILENKINSILVIILLFMFFSFQTYQRYYEPMLYLILFSLIQTKMVNIFYEKKIACIILFLYFMVFYFGSITDIIYKI